MNASFSVFGVTVYWYGLIVGIALVVGLHLIEKKALQTKILPQKFSSDFFFQTILVASVCGIVGARAWHVVTDYYLYALAVSQGNWWPLVAVWNGGLSIVGAIAGGLGGILAFFWWKKKAFSQSIIFFDLFAFGLPFGQSIGRLANFVNQELYGKPSKLPWAIFIDSSNRLEGYEKFSTYHPLFLYEAASLTIFGVVLWWYQKKTNMPLGSGKYVFVYLVFYAMLRFFLDFLRIDPIRVWMGLTVNQLVFLFVLGIMGGRILFKKCRLS